MELEKAAGASSEGGLAAMERSEMGSEEEWGAKLEVELATASGVKKETDLVVEEVWAA